MEKILLIDDSKDTHLVLNTVFSDDYILMSAFDLKQASQFLAKDVFDLILLDITLPDGDGMDFFAKLRSQGLIKETPVIFLTGKNDLATKTIGFSLGAEDYIVKPFDVLEVKLRCVVRIKKNHVKRAKEAQQKMGELRFDIPSQRAFLAMELTEKLLELTPTGFKLLLYLAQNESQVFSREQLINAVWGSGTFIVDRTVDSHVVLLRKQLNGSSISIRSVHGHGYKLTMVTAAQGNPAA